MNLYNCFICGKRSPYEDDLDECEICEGIVCIECSQMIDNKIVCNVCRKDFYTTEIENRNNRN